MPEISIIIPVYNSSVALENNLGYLIDFVSKSSDSYEIIIVDDGSEDTERLKTISNEFNVRYTGYSKNQGKGFAIKHGFKHAKGNLIIYTDADIPFENYSIDTIVNYLTKKEYDIAIGDRSLESSDYFSKVSGKRRLGSGIFTFIVGRIVTTGFTDTQCGLKGFKREVAADLFGVSQLKGFTFDVELVYIALKRNYDLKKIPVTLRSQDGNSVSVLRHGISMAFDLLKIKWNHVKGLYRRK